MNEYSQPALTRPPKREEEKHGHNDRGDLAGVRVEPTGNETGSNKRGTQVSRREGEPAHTA
jgi:hypothetical protein